MAITIKENCSLIGHNTFKIDVKATQFINYENIDELLKVLDDLCNIKETRLFIYVFFWQ